MWWMKRPRTHAHCCQRNTWKQFFLMVKGPSSDATDAPQPWGLLCNPMMKMIIFCPFPSHGAPVEWNWQGKTEVLGEKPVPLPLCPPQIPHGLTRDRTRASAVGGRQLTAWAMALPACRRHAELFVKPCWKKRGICSLVTWQVYKMCQNVRWQR
jgi:hypothetical protein